MPSVADRSGIPFRALRAALLAAALCSPSLARAEPAGGSPPQGAEASAASGPTWLSEYERGHWSAAIELLEVLPEGSRTAWHWLHLARAREKRGQLVEAFAAYERLRDVANDAPRAPG
ncbi:MAG TPA: hypothetical protein VNN80_30015, partial [Polyangiaceae bacterium]|nr:hypothetical protein [Polyangiaceae bacterium]